MAHTKLYCEAAHPENKQRMWDEYFKKDGLTKDWGLHDYQFSMLGFNQTNQYQFIKKFEEEFFSKISEVVASKGRYVTEVYFYSLSQTNRQDDAYLKIVEDLL